jgi:hypothetical protein
MIETNRLPEQLESNISSEKKEFAVFSRRSQPIKSSLGLVLFGTFWLAFTSIFVVAFLGPLFVGQEVHFTSDGNPVTAGPGNLKPVLLPAMFIGIFVLVGIGMLGFGLYSLFKSGGYFVGTPTRLIHYRNGTIRSINWEQFSGDIEVSGDDRKGNIALGMRTGKMVSRKSGSQYVPDVVNMVGIPDIINVERICRQRIRENDPTPVTS